MSWAAWSGSRWSAGERGPGCPVAAVRGARAARGYRELQALEDAVNYRLARLAAPCPHCEPVRRAAGVMSMRCDVALIAGYLKRRDARRWPSSRVHAGA